MHFKTYKNELILLYIIFKKAQAIAGKIIILFYRLYDIILMANQPNGHIRMLVEVGTMKGKKNSFNFLYSCFYLFFN